MRQDGKGLVVEGEYEIGEGMKSARGCGLRISVSPHSSLLLASMPSIRFIIIITREEG